jgi:flagellar biosynthesis/type III secretory pathway protein FliH
MAALLISAGPAGSGAPRPWVPASWPDDGSDRPSTPPGETLAALRSLWFGEDELAQAAAAAARAAARDARAACAEDQLAGQALALERIAATLTGAVQAHENDATLRLQQLIDLAGAIARTLIVDSDGSRAAAAVEAVQVMLATLPRETAVRIAVGCECAPMLAAALPEIAGRLGCTGTLDVVGDARLPPGAVQLTWPGGWLEHAPAALEQRLAQLLAAARPATAPNPALDDGEDHGLD